jgi:hypothetical protein
MPNNVGVGAKLIVYVKDASSDGFYDKMAETTYTVS